MKYCSVCKEKFDDTLSFCPTDGEVLEEDPTSLVGAVLDGQYQIEGILGKGGMGAVYRARHILLGDRVAIKMLPPEMRSNAEWLRRFQREGQAARRFRHPNAVTVYDLRTSADGTIYLVMEYVEGSTLDVELKRHGRFSPAEALVVLQPIISVLNAAHAMGVVHRDLKPENIMIGRPPTGGEPVVKLLDLGIAKLREVAGTEKIGTTALTIAGQMLGTPYYMSPEQWGELPRDRNSDIDGRADIYSLGIVFYELITGKRPFGGLTLSELRREHVSNTAPLLHEVVPNVPDGYSEAIAKAIAKDRADRQATAGELENDLMTSLAAEGIMPSITLAGSLSPEASAPSTVTGAQRVALTAADRTAPTVVGESVLTEMERPEPVRSNVGNQAATIPTVVSAERGKMPAPVAAPIQPPALAGSQRRSPLLFIGAVVVAFLVVLGAGGIAYKKFISSSAGNNTGPNTNGNNGTNGTDLPAHEVARYWLEIKTANSTEDAIRAGDLIALDSGQQFRFHFSPSENGYLYIIGPGEKNAPTTFLTAKPHPDSGLKSNVVKSGQNFAFPADTRDRENWLNLDRAAGTDEFTMIFSPNPLETPGFLVDLAGHELTSDELKQLEGMRTEFKANAVGTELIKTGASPSVSVKVPQTEGDGAPVIFRVRIEHK